MAPDAGKTNQRKKNGFLSKIVKNIDTSLLQWTNHVTAVDLSNKNITFIDETTKFPPNLYNLDLSHNALNEVPQAVMSLDKVKILNLSYNDITYFDDTPKFCHSIEALNLARNNLSGPPYWVWVETPKNLTELNLTYNINLTKALTNDYIDELLQYETLVSYIKIANCCLKDHQVILSTFKNAKTVELGSTELTTFINYVGEIPFTGLDKCCDIIRLSLSNTHIYNIKSSIDIYKNIVEIDLSQNYLRDLPKEFCNLEKLEICLLSYNNILYLPDDFFKLKKLVRLHVNNNELCTLPEGITELKDLQYLDLYNNCLYEVSDDIKNVDELDLAQNYFDEPEDADYVLKKEKFRINLKDRYDGRKIEVERPESEFSSCSEIDDEELLGSIASIDSNKDLPPEPVSSPEDWDSDDYWVPCYLRRVITPPHSPWLNFIKRKMAEGSFCPIDAHAIPAIELVKYERLCNPRTCQVVTGQFDDYSGDDS